MKKSEIAKLRKENQVREKQLFAENRRIVEKSVTYLYQKKADDYAVECVRGDLIDMLLDGERRGMAGSQVIGGDYRGVCDEILRSVPKLTEDKRWRKNAGSYFVLLPLLGLFDMITKLFFIIKSGEAWTLGNALLACVPFAVYSIVAILVYILAEKSLDFYITWMRGKKRYVVVLLVIAAAGMQIAYYVMRG